MIVESRTSPTGLTFAMLLPCVACQVNRSNIHEDLGVIDYIFSDKTGTLTQVTTCFTSPHPPTHTHTHTHTRTHTHMRTQTELCHVSIITRSHSLAADQNKMQLRYLGLSGRAGVVGSEYGSQETQVQ